LVIFLAPLLYFRGRVPLSPYIKRYRVCEI
jgi:hypothetical protein